MSVARYAASDGHVEKKSGTFRFLEATRAFVGTLVQSAPQMDPFPLGYGGECEFFDITINPMTFAAPTVTTSITSNLVRSAVPFRLGGALGSIYNLAVFAAYGISEISLRCVITCSLITNATNTTQMRFNFVPVTAGATIPLSDFPGNSPKMQILAGYTGTYTCTMISPIFDPRTADPTGYNLTANTVGLLAGQSTTVPNSTQLIFDVVHRRFA